MKRYIINSCFVFYNGSNQKKQFIKLSHKDTGIDFVNKLYETNTRNYYLPLYVFRWWCGATGDFNNDGLEDLFFTGIWYPMFI